MNNPAPGHERGDPWPVPEGGGLPFSKKNKRYRDFKYFTANSYPINCAHLVAIPIASLDTIIHQ